MRLPQRYQTVLCPFPSLPPSLTLSTTPLSRAKILAKAGSQDGRQLFSFLISGSFLLVSWLSLFVLYLLLVLFLVTYRFASFHVQIILANMSVYIYIYEFKKNPKRLETYFHKRKHLDLQNKTIIQDLLLLENEHRFESIWYKKTFFSSNQHLCQCSISCCDCRCL